MTEPESPHSTPETGNPVSTALDAAPAEAPEPAPIPWTTERVSEWNSYYDVYVMLGALLLAFLASANRINHSAIWAQLKTGAIIAAQGQPLTTDPFSYSAEGRRWVNVPWLFDVAQALLHKGALDAAPTDPTDPTASAARADQIAAGVLVGLSALVRALTILVILSIRRPGPGRWWACCCGVLALGAGLNPWGIGLGGLAGAAIVAPSGWGLFLLSLELLLIHRTVNLGKRGAIFGLVPLFLLWVNVDESFFFGLLVLAGTVLGRLRVDDRETSERLTATRGLIVLGMSLAVCLANPSVFRVFPAAASPLLLLFQPRGGPVTMDQLSYFGKELRQINQAAGALVPLPLYYLIVVALGLGSFLLNRRRFSTGRFLVYAFAALLWGVLIKFGPEFALIFAVTLTLNGQEWYHDQFGTRGRLGRGWAVWSTGGRLVTLGLFFGAVFLALTSWFKLPGESTFGFGYNPDDFAFEAAEYLRTAPIQGAVLNTSLNQGDSLIWRAYPQRKTYIDSRQHLFSATVLDRLREVRLALSEDAVERWRPFLDEYKISAVMIEEAASPNTYRRLMQSPNWVPFHDDGKIVLFGRADAPAADLAFFQAHRLDPDLLAYRQSHPVPSPERPPTPSTDMDRIFQGRSLMPPQSHTESALRWLQSVNPETGAPDLPDPAHCFLAIQEARTALARQPDDWRAYRILGIAHRALMIEEAALLAGVKLTPENRARLRENEPAPGLLMNRFRERATALNFAIQAAPPPSTVAAAVELRAMNLELFQLYVSVNFLDLARNRLRAALARPRGVALTADSGDLPAEVRTALGRELTQLDDRARKVKEQMDDLTTEQQASPLQRANFAVSQGAVGLALVELEEADRTGLNPAIVRPQLLDLYCDTGQPDKAAELLSTGNVDDPALGGEPGVAALRQARVYSLLGNYEYACSLLQERAIPQLRFERGIRVLTASQIFLKGEIVSTVNSYLGIPTKIATQSSWEYELALDRLESGLPELAAEHFTKALTLAPNLQVRPIAAYYLERLGKPVPPPILDKPKPVPSPKPKDEPAKAETSKDEKPKDEKPEAK